MEKKIIYFDNAATTKPYDEVVESMMPFLKEYYGNPSSVYNFAKEVKMRIEDAREKIGELLGVTGKEIYFTSGATEANNWAIRGAVKSYSSKGRHIITTNIEHHAVLHVFEELEKEGYDLTILPVGNNGIVNLDDLKNAIREDTIFVSIMSVNNEIGTIQPIEEIAKILNEKKIIFHTDAVQRIGKEKLNLRKMGIDLLSFSGHKFHGPKAIGGLYIKKGVRIGNLVFGGAQERNKRPGTENVPGIIGLCKALELSMENIEEKQRSILDLRNYLVDKILATIPHTIVNGDLKERIPGNVNFSFRFIEGEGMLLSLDMYGICASSGSACTSGSLDPSHVLLALGLPHEIAHGSLRITISEFNNKEEVDFLIQVLPTIIKRLREMSPLYEDYLKEK